MLYLFSVFISVILLTLWFFLAKKTRPEGIYTDHVCKRLTLIGLYLNCLIPFTNVAVSLVLLLVTLFLIIDGEYVFKEENDNRFSAFIDWLNEKI